MDGGKNPGRNYGDYKGILSAEIYKLRKDQSLSENWDI